MRPNLAPAPIWLGLLIAPCPLTRPEMVEVMTDEQFCSMRLHIRIVIALLVLLVVIQVLGMATAIMLTGG